MNGKNGSPAGVGVITLFTVLILLCLFTFAMLTFSSARADERLSRINADTVSAYYAADAQGAALAAGFAAGTEAELERTIPMTDTQSLYIHLIRNADGSVTALAWKTVTAERADDGEDPLLPVWEGG